MCTRSKIILLVLLITSCKKIDKNEFETPYIDTSIVRSEYNTKQFDLIISDVDSFESHLWTSVGNKMDSLIDELTEEERNLPPHVLQILLQNRLDNLPEGDHTND